MVMRTYKQQYNAIQRAKKIILDVINNDDWNTGLTPDEVESMRELYDTLSESAGTVIKMEWLIKTLSDYIHD